MRASQSLRRPAELIEAGLAPAERRAALAAVAERYAVAITPAVAELIDTADPDDPIARQFIPDPAELMVRPEELADPIGDDVHSPVEGVVHRYPDRVLLKLVHVCPVYCRFCFRREMVGPRGRGTLSPRKLEAALDYIRAQDRIWEVILTGGDPLVLAARRVRAVMRQLAAIDHVKIIRVHTRVPVVAPALITPELARALRSQAQATYVVLHINHARELTQQARAACAQLVDAGIPLLSQTVLLKGVNDAPATLAELFRALVENRIKPYYLHHADLAPGTGHLRTTIADGQRLMRALRGTLSGLCQPTYVLDIPGGAGKVPAGPTYLKPLDCGRYEVEDPSGGRRVYPPGDTP
ncbi:MAG: lysine-2,3-aminomutase-like protein [Xanthobacteraceae bacterium]